MSVRGLVVVAALAIAGCSHSSKGKVGDAGALADAGDASTPIGDGGLADGGDDGGAAMASEDALPSSIAPDLADRSKHLVEAIAKNDPSLAQDFVFPRDAYAASHDRSDASSQWDKRVQGSFAHDVNLLHKKIKDASHATFLSFELGHEVQQIQPKPKDFNRPLWLARHSKITMSVGGKTERIDVVEMTGWKGAWYITKLR